MKGIEQFGLNCSVKKSYEPINKSLRVVYLPKNATAVVDFAFSGFESLEKVILSEGVKSLGNHAFANCMSLNAMHIPASVDTIGNCCFLGCLQLEQFVASENAFKVIDGVLYSKTADALIAYPAGKK